MLKKLSLIIGLIFLMVVSLSAFASAATVELTVDLDAQKGQLKNSEGDESQVEITYTVGGVETTESIVMPVDANTFTETATFTVDVDEPVTLTANPGTYEEFKNWDGNSQLNTLTHTVTPSADTTVTAKFDFLKLVITDLDGEAFDWVGGDGKSENNLHTGINNELDDIMPGGSIKLNFDVQNNFKRSQNVKIEDVEIRLVVESWEDDDELDETIDEFDINSGREKTNKKLTFDVPLEADDITYSAVVTVTGSHEDTNEEYSQTLEFGLKVEKETNDVRVYRNTLSSSNVICSRDGIRHELGLVNMGDNSEDTIEVETTNSDLGINFKEIITDLSSGSFDDDILDLVSYKFDVPEDLEAGVYPIDIRVTFDDGKDTVDYTKNVVVEACDVDTTPTTTLPPVDDTDDDLVEVIITQPVDDDLTGNVVIDPTDDHTEDEEVEDKGIFSNTAFVAVLIGAEVLVALLVIILIVGLTKRR
tara:strand:+ start:366 stop:1793 length:1428 start_codon:yes stop_codon:yes gene_type:complete